MSHRLYVTITAILTFPSGAPALYPGDCVPTPGGPVVTARVVQKLSNDPPQFEVEFEACKVTAVLAPMWIRRFLLMCWGAPRSAEPK
jgi:hypothetical protein